MSQPSAQQRLVDAIKANKDADAVRALLSQPGVDINAVKITDDDPASSHFMAPLLYLATREEDEDSAQTVRVEGAIPVSRTLDLLLAPERNGGLQDLPDPDGATLLFFACCAGTPRLVELLLFGTGGRANSASSPGGVSRSVVAAPTRYKENGLDDNLSDKTPLAAAVERGDAEGLEIAALLLAAGAERAPPAPHVLSALHLAVESDAKRQQPQQGSSSFEFLDLLLSQGWPIGQVGRTVWAPNGDSDFDKSVLAQACFVDQYSDLARAKAMMAFLLARGAVWNAHTDAVGFARYTKRCRKSEDGVGARPFALPLAFAKGDEGLRRKMLAAGCPDTAQLPAEVEASSDDESDEDECGGDFEEFSGSDDDLDADDASSTRKSTSPARGSASAAGGGAAAAATKKAPADNKSKESTQHQKKKGAKKQ